MSKNDPAERTVRDIRRKTRKQYTAEEKIRIVAQSYAPGVSVSVVARRYDVNANLIFTWRRDPRYQPAEDGEGTPSFLPVEVVPLSAVVGAGRGIGGSPTPARDELLSKVGDAGFRRTAFG